MCIYVCVPVTERINTFCESCFMEMVQTSFALILAFSVFHFWAKIALGFYMKRIDIPDLFAYGSEPF